MGNSTEKVCQAKQDILEKASLTKQFKKQFH